MKEIKPLTSLRAIAAFLVFMFHYATVFRPSHRGLDVADGWVPFMPIWEQGRIGVCMFFVLSGFLITRVYYDRLTSGQTTLRLYLVKRIARIWPLFLAYAAIHHLVGAIFPGLGDIHDPTLPDVAFSMDLAVTLTMIQGFFRDLWYAGLPTAWSLTVEETFYVVAPLVFLLIAFITGQARHRDPRLGFAGAGRLAVALGLAAALLVGFGEAGGTWVRSAGWNWQGFLGTRSHTLHMTLFGRFPEFAIGMFCAFIHRDGRLVQWLPPTRANRLAMGCILGIVFCLLAKNNLQQAVGYSDVWSVGGRAMAVLVSYLVALLTGLLILALTIEGTPIFRFLSARPFVFMGKISYGFYLVQVSVLMAPLVWLTDKLGPARLPALIGLATGVCLLSYQLIEVPARRAIVNRWGGASDLPGGK